eukprot:tig00000237_g20484.t1
MAELDGGRDGVEDTSRSWILRTSRLLRRAAEKAHALLIEPHAKVSKDEKTQLLAQSLSVAILFSLPFNVAWIAPIWSRERCRLALAHVIVNLACFILSRTRHVMIAVYLWPVLLFLTELLDLYALHALDTHITFVFLVVLLQLVIFILPVIFSLLFLAFATVLLALAERFGAPFGISQYDWWFWYAFAVLSSFGVAAYVAGRERRAVALVEDALGVLKEETNMKTQFIANVSHEMRTPLTAVCGAAELLRESGLDEEQAELVGMIESAAEGAVRLVTSILDYSKLAAGVIELKEELFDVRDLFENCVGAIWPVARLKNLSVDLLIDCPFHEPHVGDTGKIRQATFNFLSNAIKLVQPRPTRSRRSPIPPPPPLTRPVAPQFTQQGSIEVSVFVTPDPPRRRYHVLEVRVRDNGPGIPKDKMQLLFRRFMQLHDAMTGKVQGTGLGLAITKSLVEAMGGTVWVESAQDPLQHGSTFGFRLPLRRRPGPGPGPLAAPGAAGRRPSISLSGPGAGEGEAARRPAGAAAGAPTAAPPRRPPPRPGEGDGPAASGEEAPPRPPTFLRFPADDETEESCGEGEAGGEGPRGAEHLLEAPPSRKDSESRRPSAGTPGGASRGRVRAAAGSLASVRRAGRGWGACCGGARGAPPPPTPSAPSRATARDRRRAPSPPSRPLPAAIREGGLPARRRPADVARRATVASPLAPPSAFAAPPAPPPPPPPPPAPPPSAAAPPPALTSPAPPAAPRRRLRRRRRGRGGRGVAAGPRVVNRPAFSLTVQTSFDSSGSSAPGGPPPPSRRPSLCPVHPEPGEGEGHSPALRPRAPPRAPAPLAGPRRHPRAPGGGAAQRRRRDAGPLRPLRPAAAAATGPSERGPAKPTPPPGAGAGRGGRWRVLVCDDNEFNVRIARKMLEALGCEVAVARDGQEAVDLFAAGARLDLAFLDLQMPNKSGLEAAAEIRAMAGPGGGAAPPLLAITANVSEECRAQCRAAGFTGFIGKPFKKSDLASALDRFCRPPSPEPGPAPGPRAPPRGPAPPSSPRPRRPGPGPRLF